MNLKRMWLSMLDCESCSVGSGFSKLICIKNARNLYTKATFIITIIDVTWHPYKLPFIMKIRGFCIKIKIYLIINVRF